MPAISNTFTIGIPAYGRPQALGELLDSIYLLIPPPFEVLVCEDFSPERAEIGYVAKSRIERFAKIDIKLRYLENEVNLGYDRNIQNLINLSEGDKLIISGDDDLFLKDAIKNIEKFFLNHPHVQAVSRAFLRFDTYINSPIGVSKLARESQVFGVDQDDSGLIFRLGGFVGGLIFDVKWARSISTSKYDGGLFYQIHLMASAFCECGIGYISKPIVGGRTGNAPLFGSSGAETAFHLPGSYTPDSRAKMWGTVISIVEDAESKYKKKLRAGIMKELKVRQSFHIFEMYTGVDRGTLLRLKEKLAELELFYHPVPLFFYYLIYLFGSKSKFFFSGLRKLVQ